MEALIDRFLRVGIPILLGIMILAGTGEYFLSRSERNNVGYAPEQPIPFSHKKHAGELQINCEYCHSAARKSRHATVPSTDVCMACHSVVKTESPAIQRLTVYFNEGRPIPWQRVHKVPDFVFFSHSAHVNAGFKCQDCHGPVETMEKIRQDQPFHMGACLTCHRNPNERVSHIQVAATGPENCYGCHR